MWNVTHRPCGPTDKASDYESGDCRFESCQGQHFWRVQQKHKGNKNIAPPGGLEPPTFRLTAERASRLRHGGPLRLRQFHPWNWPEKMCFPVSRWKCVYVLLKNNTHTTIRYGLVVRIPGSHPGGPGSIPGVGNPFLNADNLLLGYHGCSKPVKNGRFWLPAKTLSKSVDEDGIRTHACRAHWISSPTP